MVYQGIGVSRDVYSFFFLLSRASKELFADSL